MLIKGVAISGMKSMFVYDPSHTALFCRGQAAQKG